MSNPNELKETEYRPPVHCPLRSYDSLRAQERRGLKLILDHSKLTDKTKRRLANILLDDKWYPLDIDALRAVSRLSKARERNRLKRILTNLTDLLSLIQDAERRASVSNPPKGIKPGIEDCLAQDAFMRIRKALEAIRPDDIWMVLHTLRWKPYVAKIPRSKLRKGTLLVKLARRLETVILAQKEMADEFDPRTLVRSLIEKFGFEMNRPNISRAFRQLDKEKRRSR